MFGESDSESPRVGSPWDSFIAGSSPSLIVGTSPGFITRSSTCPSPCPAMTTELEVKTRLGELFPKLVPEVEYGNVEYKLKLLNPSPERFTRLVTQMKWRLLEGGGQAYYELGVADSGQLVGLPRRDLEQSLETLEMMAGEIGASVIVVKEIEVPAALVGRGMNFALGIPRRTLVPAVTDGEGEVEMSTATEADTSATEDDEDPLPGLGLNTPNPIAYRQTRFSNTITRSHPERPTAQSSPEIHALHPDTTEFDGDDDEALFRLDFEIEIASVYKPRPPRARPPLSAAQSKYTRRGTPPKPKPKRLQRGADLDPVARAAAKRIQRDARRDQRQRALLVSYGGDDDNDDGTALAAAELEELHVGLDDADDTSTTADADTVTEPMEPRLIVEVLVVRKLALEEAFLDFGGFALEM